MFFEISIDDLFNKCHNNLKWNSMLIDLKKIDYIEVFDNYAIINFLNGSYVTITKECYWFLYDFLKK